MVLLAVLLVGLHVRGQLPDYHLQLFDFTAGIQPGNINSLAKDKKGGLWILYRRQVQRFDGKRIETFKMGDFVDHLLCDSRGRVWLITPSKALLFSEPQGKFIEIPFIIKDASFQAGPIIETEQGQVWVSCNTGMMQYDSAKRAFLPTLSELPIGRYISTRVFGFKKNSLFLRHGARIYRYNLLSKKLDSLPDSSVSKILPVNEDSILVYTWKNQSFWYNFRASTISPAELPKPLQDEFNKGWNVRSLTEISPNRFFIASQEGVFDYNNLTKQFRRLQFYYNGDKVISKDYATNIYLDKEGYAWLATMDGIARFPINHQSIGLIRIQHLHDALPASINNIRRIIEDGEGNFWMATGYGFVKWRRDVDQWEYFFPKIGSETGLAHPSVRGLVYDGRYLIVGPTDLGIWLFDPATLKYRRPTYDDSLSKKSIEGDFVNTIITLRDGDHLIAARDASYLLDGRSYRLRKLNHLSKLRSNAYFAGQRSDGNIWLSCSRSLYLLDSNLNLLREVEGPLKDQFVSCAFILPDDRLLFATDDGVFTADYRSSGPISITPFTKVFNKISLQTIFQDNRQVIWASSENGIYRFDPATSKLNLFDHSDNVQGYGFNGNAWFRSKRGILFLGGVNGLNYLQPETFTVPDELPTVYIRQARVGNRDSSIYVFNEPMTIRYAQRSLEVEFASSYFNNQAKLQYRYRLEGVDNEWKDIGNNNVVRFTSLSPGHYVLKVQASLNRVNWVDAKNEFSFRIRPPFWMTWWFIGLVCLLFIGAIRLLLVSRNRQIMEKQEELDTEQAINYFASSIYETNSVKVILWDVVKNCIGRLHFEDCVIYLLDLDRKVLIQRAAHGPKSSHSFDINSPIEIPLGKGITGTVALTGKAEIIPDTSKDPRYIVDMERRGSEIAVPIMTDNRILGVIDCEHSKKGFFTQKHLSILTTIASLCANKIVKAKAEAEKARAEAELMDTQKKMAEAEMQALRAQMNPHFIFNCLNSINRYIVKSDQATASLYLTRFAKLIRLILDNSNSKTVTLTNELEALRLYIEMESIRFEKKFSYRIIVAGDVQPDSIYVPPLIIQPYVENAIWHGLLHKEEAGELVIYINRTRSGMLECVIEDNGIGREKAKELRSKSASGKKSLGMKLTEDRLALLNREAQFDSSVEVEDMKTQGGEAMGTRVIVKIPIDN